MASISAERESVQRYHQDSARHRDLALERRLRLHPAVRVSGGCLQAALQNQPYQRLPSPDAQRGFLKTPQLLALIQVVFFRTKESTKEVSFDGKGRQIALEAGAIGSRVDVLEKEIFLVCLKSIEYR